MSIKNQLVNIPKLVINNFIKKEFALFLENYDKRPISKEQDLRTMSILWLTYYFSEHINKQNREKIVDFVNEQQGKNDYIKNEWYKMPALDITAFLLTKEHSYIENTLFSLGCGDSVTRAFILYGVSLIIPLLRFDNYNLRDATEYNIEKYHRLYKENIFIYLMTRGTKEEKISWLEYLIEKYEEDNRKELFENILKNKIKCDLTFIALYYNKVKSYILFRVLDDTSLTEIQLDLFEDEDENYDLIKLREQEHPIFNKEISFNWLD